MGTARGALRFGVVYCDFQDLKFTFTFSAQVLVNRHCNVLWIYCCGKPNAMQLEVKSFTTVLLTGQLEETENEQPCGQDGGQR